MAGIIVGKMYADILAAVHLPDKGDSRGTELRQEGRSEFVSLRDSARQKKVQFRFRRIRSSLLTTQQSTISIHLRH